MITVVDPDAVVWPPNCQHLEPVEDRIVVHETKIDEVLTLRRPTASAVDRLGLAATSNVATGATT